MGRPLDQVRCILVGGTNGKGTTCAFLAVLLKRLGYRTALYTSPHLQHYSERVWIDGSHPKPSHFGSALAALKAQLTIELFDQLSFFEVVTLLAFEMFRAAKVEVAVLEVGMGGRWDATNICDPEISAITGVAFDHQQYLGNELSAIVLEKVGIARHGKPLFWGGGGALAMARDAEQLGLKTLRDIGAVVLRRGIDFGVDPQGFWAGTVDVLRCKPANPAWPEFLKANFSLAFAIAERFCPGLRLEVADAASGNLLGEACWPRGQRGRFEQTQINTKNGSASIILDVCHNVDGANALCESLIKVHRSKLPGMVSILADKDFDQILDVLKTCLEPIVLFRCNSPRSWKSENLTSRHRDLHFAEDFSEGWAKLDRHRKAELPVVICGSVAAVGDVLNDLANGSHEW